MQRLILPLPPSVNKAYRNFTTESGRRMRVPTHRANAFKKEAGWEALAWKNKTHWRMPGTEQKVIVRMWIWWKNKNKHDADNLLKVTLDSVKGILFPDDNMCLPQIIDFDYDKSNPRIELEFEVVEV